MAMSAGPSGNAAPRDGSHLPLTRRYWSMATVVMGSQLFEFFDFFIVGFVVSMIAKPWHLTFGEIAIILLTSGAGAIVGSLVWGWLGDRFGRRPALIASIATFALGTGLSAATPVGWWWLLALLRVIVGIGVGGGNSVGPPLIVEFTPTRQRVVIGGLATVTFIPIGVLLTSFLAATLGPIIGFRGMLLLGLLPLLLAVWALWAVPESPRWLLSQGRKQEADAVVNRIFGVTTGCGAAFKPEAAHAAPRYIDTLRYPVSFWSVALLWLFADTIVIGLILWGPTLLSQVLGVSPAGAARLFIWVSLAGFLGRLTFPFVAQALGRKQAGAISGIGGAVLLAMTGLFHSAMIGTASAFYVFFLLSNFFFDGGWTNLVPWTAEVWPAPLRARGQGVGNAFGGLGKMLGPALLGLMAGSGNLVTPQATLDVITPVFLTFAGCSVAIAVVFLLLAPETARASLDEIAFSMAGKVDAKRLPDPD